MGPRLTPIVWDRDEHRRRAVAAELGAVVATSAAGLIDPHHRGSLQSASRRAELSSPSVAADGGRVPTSPVRAEVSMRWTPELPPSQAHPPVHRRSDRFVWLRGFTDMKARREGLEAFYGGPTWKAHAAAANATMIDSDNVFLLRAARSGSTFRPLRRLSNVDRVGLVSEAGEPDYYGFVLPHW
jgi:hypothetical protein